MSYKDYRLSPDTTPTAEALVFERLRNKSPAAKLEMVGKMNATVRALAISGLSERHPGETDLQLKIRFVELLYGSKIARQISDRFNGSGDQ